MSLVIYATKDEIPEEKRFIFDVNAWFDEVPIVNDELTAKILKFMDKAKYYDERRFLDRFDTALYWKYISTGSKILLMLHMMPDVVVNGIELGRNGIELLGEFKEGFIYLPQGKLKVYTEDENGKIDIVYNNIHYTDVEDFNMGGLCHEIYI